jgi:excisionase family DNA binding protein
MKDALNRPLNVREVADALGLSVHTIRAWISRGRLTHVRLGRAIRVLPDEIQRVLRNAAVPAIDPLHRKQSVNEPDESKKDERSHAAQRLIEGGR